MISVSVPSLALSADVAVRRLTEDNLRRTQAELDQRVSERTAELADANIHLTEAQRLANLGSWSWDVVRQQDVTGPKQLFDIYGLRPDQFRGTLNEFIGFIHPDDRAQVQASIGAALKSGNEFQPRGAHRAPGRQHSSSAQRRRGDPRRDAAPPSACSASVSM